MPYTYEQALEAIGDEELKSAILSRMSELENGKTKVIGEVREKNQKLRDAEAALAQAQAEIQGLLEGADPSVSINEVVQKVSKEKRELQLANQRLKAEAETVKSELATSKQELQTVTRKYTLQEVGRLTGFDPQVLSNIAAIDVDGIEISNGKVYYNSSELETAIANDPTLSMFLPSLKKETLSTPEQRPTLPSAPSNPNPAKKTGTDLVADYLKRSRPNFNKG